MQPPLVKSFFSKKLKLKGSFIKPVFFLLLAKDWCNHTNYIFISFIAPLPYLSTFQFCKKRKFFLLYYHIIIQLHNSIADKLSVCYLNDNSSRNQMVNRALINRVSAEYCIKVKLLFITSIKSYDIILNGHTYVYLDLNIEMLCFKLK